MEGGFGFLLSQLLYQAPLIIVALLGVILSIVLWGRCPGSALMTLLASILLLLASIGSAAMQSYFWSALVDRGWDHETYGRINAIVGLVGAVLRGLAVGLIVIAVF